MEMENEISPETENSNIRILPHVCGNKKCRKLILPPFEYLAIYIDIQCTGFIEVCRECKDEDIRINIEKGRIGYNNT